MVGEAPHGNNLPITMKIRNTAVENQKERIGIHQVDLPSTPKGRGIGCHRLIALKKIKGTSLIGKNKMRTTLRSPTAHLYFF